MSVIDFLFAFFVLFNQPQRKPFLARQKDSTNEKFFPKTCHFPRNDKTFLRIVCPGQFFPLLCFSNTLSFFFASANLKILFLIENFLAGKLKTCHDWCTIEYYSYFFSFCLLLCSMYLYYIHTLIKKNHKFTLCM